MDQIQPTIYQEMPTDLRRASKVIVLAGNQFREYDLNQFGKDRIYFGRNEAQNDIVIPIGTVSGSHGKIKIQNGDIYVADLESSNGTYFFDGTQYVRMKPNKYYKKTRSDWIFRIDSRKKNSDHSAVVIFTNSETQGAWQCMPLDEGLSTIGRASDNTIVMKPPNFSRHHAGIYRRENHYMLVDYNSMNGVYVNGVRIHGQKEIHEKDMIQIAGSLFLLNNGKLMYQTTISGVSLTLENICKTVGHGSSRKRILNNVSCEIGNNEFVAIIGGSGAGKTTVMNAMSGFDSDISGRVYCNGIDLRRNFNTLKNMIGFVPQQDIIYENLTLQRMLYYTAKMKMPSDTSKAEIRARIHKVLEMVDLVQHAKTYIRKLSGGQKKRASIAVEMLADPGLFFLDEPTSGLDPDTEQSLMHTLAKLSKSEGKTIIMVTHTIQSIDLCDKVIFMGPGGKICYCGPPSEITNYFGKKSLVEVYNELAGNVDNWNGYFLQNYYMEKQNNPPSQAPHPNAGLEKKGKQVSSFKQCLVLIARYFELIWNDKQRLLLLFIQPIAIAFLLAVVAVDDTFITYEDTRSIMFALSCSGIWIGLFNAIQEVCKERPILKREYMGNLRLWGYIVSKYVVQSVICFLQATLLVAIFLRLMKHSAEAGLYFAKPGMEIWITMILTIFASASMGLIVSSLMKNGDRAMAVAPFVLIIQLLFSGVLFTLDGMAEHVSKITVSRWAMECLGNITNLNKLTSRLSPGGVHEVEDYYVRTTTHLAHTWEVLILVAVLCGIISIVVLRSLKKDHR
ncbi:MAG: ATP-binding cassette domain-containing protein [Eubacterium sp.]